jgi:hypothetical protein
MTPLLPLSRQGKILSLSLIFMATCYHMNCVWTLTKQLLKSPSLLPTLLYLASNPIYHACTKQIEIDYHFVPDMVAKKLLEVCFVFGKNQLADILTKPLVAARFIMLRFNLNVDPPMSSLRGRIGLDLLSENDKCKVLELDQDSSSMDNL